MFQLKENKWQLELHLKGPFKKKINKSYTQLSETSAQFCALWLTDFLPPASQDASDGNNPSVNCKSGHVKTPTMLSPQKCQRNTELA